MYDAVTWQRQCHAQSGVSCTELPSSQHVVRVSGHGNVHILPCKGMARRQYHPSVERGLSNSAVGPMRSLHLHVLDEVRAATCEHANLDDALGLRELDQHLQQGDADCWRAHPRHGLPLQSVL